MSAVADGAMEIRVEPLADHPEALPILKEWFEREWAPYYGPAGPGDAEADLRASCGREQLPIALVAFCGGELCGTAALKRESVTTHPHLSPWLAALLVAPGFRRRGVGARLIAAVEELAAGMGFQVLYVGTGEGSGTPESAIRARGWRFLERRPYTVGDVLVFAKEL